MSQKTTIEWTDCTWSPIRVRVKQDAAAIAEAKGYTSLVHIAAKMAGHVGQHCEKVSDGCAFCYSETEQHRCLPNNGTGLPFDRRSRDLVDAFMDEKVLEQPLRWRKPRMVFVENQSDLFGEWVTDEAIDRVFAVMALCPQHTFQVLTKRAARMWEYFDGLDYTKCRSAETCWTRIYRIAGLVSVSQTQKWRDWNRALPAYDSHPFRSACWPLPNLWLGVSVEDRAHEDRIDILRETPAAVRFLSLEPLLEDIGTLDLRGIHWVICGGESGPGARPFDLAWARAIRDQCKADVAFFMKQMGSRPYEDNGIGFFYAAPNQGPRLSYLKLRDRKGGDMREFPLDLRVREFPNG